MVVDVCCLPDPFDRSRRSALAGVMEDPSAEPIKEMQSVQEGVAYEGAVGFAVMVRAIQRYWTDLARIDQE